MRQCGGGVKCKLAVVALPALAGAIWMFLSWDSDAPVRLDNSEAKPSEKLARKQPTSPPRQGGKACADLELTASAVMPRIVEGEAPSASGGKVTDGVYDSVAFETYGPLAELEKSRPFLQTLRFEDSGRKLTMARPSLHGGIEVLAFASELGEGSLTLTGRCPDDWSGRSQTLKFSASAETLEVHGVRLDGIHTRTRFRKRAFGSGATPSSSAASLSP